MNIILGHWDKFLFELDSDEGTSNLLASHFTNLRGTSVLTNSKRQPMPYLWTTPRYLEQRPSTTPEKNFPEYLVKVAQEGKSLDRFCLYKTIVKVKHISKHI